MQIHLPGHVPKFKQENQTWTVCHTVHKRTSGPFTSSNIHTCTKPGKKSLLIKELIWAEQKTKTKQNKKEIDNLYICFVILFLFCQEGKKNTWGTTTTTAGPSSASSSSFRFLSENQNPSLPIKKLFSLSLSLWFVILALLLLLAIIL